ncbi:hypothetical protein HYW35_04095 [Candidatus Saccharibacteria bacterium]|nr:hypothetical protein [Candidatus Saccharibacteria bacterium]
MISDKFVILGATLHLIGSSTYILHTIQGKTKPNRVSWFMWAFAAFVAFGAELHEGVGLQALMTFMVGFSPFLIFLASFVNRRAYWKITKFDIICGVLSLLGLLLWFVTKEGSAAIAFAIAGDTFAGIPTFKKAFSHPETESYFLFLMTAIYAGITLLTIEHWDFATYAFPIYIFVATIYLFVTVKFRLGPRLMRHTL